LPDIFRNHSPWWDFVFQQDGALAHRARDAVVFLEQKVPDFIPPTLWPPNSPDLNPVVADEHSIYSVLQEKVYRLRIASVNELETCLIDAWACFDLLIVDAATGQWRRRLNAFVPVFF